VVQHRASSGQAASPADDSTLLTGLTIGLVSDRRRHRVADLLARHGARVVSVQGVRVVPQPDAAIVARTTARCLEAPFDDAVAGSPVGVRAWFQHAADPEPLRAAMRSSRLLAADPRTADALRAAGLTDILSTAAGSADELYRYLLTHEPAGRRIAAQLDGPGPAEACGTLRLAGASVVEVPTFVTRPPNDMVGMRRIVELTSRRQLDAVGWLDPLATGHILRFAAEHGRLADMVGQLGTHIPAVCRGPLSAAVLGEHGIEPVTPALPFDEETAALLARLVLDRVVRVTVAGRQLEVRGHAILLDGHPHMLQQVPVDVLRALARQPGQSLSSADIRRAVPGLANVHDHAIEMAVSRLRHAVPDIDLVQTVIKHGYRLAV
jgi:uroporphyrinogen-III synthase